MVWFRSLFENHHLVLSVTKPPLCLCRAHPLRLSPKHTQRSFTVGWEGCLTLCCSALRAPPLRPLPVRALVLYRRNIGLNARPWKRKGKLIRLSPRPSAGCAGPVILPLGRRLAQEAREYQRVVRVHCSFDSFDACALPPALPHFWRTFPVNLGPRERPKQKEIRNS